MSNYGVRTDLATRQLTQTLVTDFFGSFVPVEISREIYPLNDVVDDVEEITNKVEDNVVRDRKYSQTPVYRCVREAPRHSGWTDAIVLVSVAAYAGFRLGG